MLCWGQVLGAEAISPRRAVVPANLHEVQQARFLPANWTAEKALLDDLGAQLRTEQTRLLARVFS